MESALESLISKLRPGDHIASERHEDLYEHHGIYIGQVNGYHMVTHYKAPNKDLRKGGGPDAKCTTCDFELPEDGGLVSSCLDCFCHGERTYIIKYKVTHPYSESGGDLKPGNVIHGYRNKKLYLELFICGNLIGYMKVSPDENLKIDNQVYLSKYPSCRTPEEVIEAATSNSFSGKYSFLYNNCEDFAVSCMIGKERSIQAENQLNFLYRPGKVVHLMIKDRKKLAEKVEEKTRGLFSSFSPS